MRERKLLKVLEVEINSVEGIQKNLSSLDIPAKKIPHIPGEVTDYDRIRFTAGPEFREFEFEGIQKVNDSLTKVHLGDLKLKNY